MNAFDDQLAQSAPAVPARTPALDAELARVVAEAERLTTRPLSRKRARFALGGLVALGLVGAGGTAGAVAGVLPWFDSAPSSGVVSTSSGDRCTLTFGIKQVDDPAAPVAPAVRAEAIAVGTAFLGGLDFATLDVAETSRKGGPRRTVDSEAGPAVSVAEFEVEGVYEAVAKRLDAELTSRQLPASSLGLSMLSNCDGDAR